MITQGKNESRLLYLLRVATVYIEAHPDYEVDYDETTCDGYCLADELRNEIGELQRKSDTMQCPECFFTFKQS